MSDRYYLIRTPTLTDIKNAISQSKDSARFPVLHVTDGKELHYIYRQTLVDIADIIREKLGTTGEIPVTRLAELITAVDNTSAVLGKAILGSAILGSSVSLPKLGTPIIRIDTVLEKLDAPTIYLHEPETPSISPPANVYVSNNTLVWYYVDGADSYIVYIEGASGDITSVNIDSDIVRTLDLTPYCDVGTWTLWVCSKMTVDGVECVSVPSEKVTYIVELPKLNAPEIYIEELPKLNAPEIYIEEASPAECAHATYDIIKRVDKTCTEDGYITYRCADCGYEYNEIIQSTGHIWNEPYYSNEFETGYGMTCNHCGDRCPLVPPMEKLLSPTIYIETVTPKLDAPQIYLQCMHEDYTTRTIIEASCETDGKSTNICKNCGHQWETVIPSIGHKHGEPERTREPTCTKPAEYAVRCTVCNTEVDRYEDDGEFAEHIPDGGRVTKEATCDTAGEYTYYCRECGIWVKTDIIPASGHTWGSPYYSSEFSSGYGQKCATCGELQELAYIECDHPKSACHESVITNPTCTVPGSKTCSCDVCCQSWTVSTPALGHKYVEYVVIDHTCTTPAIQKYKCLRCDEDKPFESSDIIRPAPGHKWGDPYYSSEFSSEYGHKCTVCGELEELDYVECQHPDSARSEVITTPATCTTVGIKTCSCNVCGSSWSEEIAVLGHSFTLYLSDNNATCFADGTKTAKCDNCTVTNTIADYGTQLEHNMGSWETHKAATCTEQGIERSYCQHGCGYFDARYTNKIAHSYNSVVTAPTCTDKGYTTHTCTVCGHSYTDNETDPNGHFWGVNGGWVTVTPATCVDEGKEKHTCNTCGLVDTRDIPATGHSYTSKVTAPTCLAKGYTTHTCSVCDHSYTDGEKSALGHDPGTPVRVREATCTVPAQYVVYCTRCNIEIDRYENDGEFAEHIADGGRITKYATCTTTGTYTYRCRECDTWLRDEVIAELGHDYQYDYTEDATCTDGGYDVFTCTRCKDWYTDNETDPLGHDWEYYPDPTVSSGTSRVCRRCERVEEDV